MIFLTVGSMFPFDRLIEGVDGLVGRGVIKEEIRAQIGTGTYEPRNMPFDRFMEKAQFDDLMQHADGVISHAGVGTIATALQYGRCLIVLPRLKQYGEHVNDHQVGTARKYAELGHVLVANSIDDIEALYSKLATFCPAPRTVNATGVAKRVERFLGDLERDQSR